jgi:hypothetical protein
MRHGDDAAQDALFSAASGAPRSQGVLECARAARGHRGRARARAETPRVAIRGELDYG